MTRNHGVATVLALALGAPACAGQRIPPEALVDARAQFIHAKDGLAMQLDPTDVHEADLALQRAERAWANSPDDPTSVDLAIIAERKALIAQAEAAAIQAQKETEQAKRDAELAKAAQLQSARGQLTQSQQALGVTQMQLQQERVRTTEQQQRVKDLETKVNEARETIARIATVKDDDRGMVITLQGEVLFKTGKWDLKPGAMARLDQIAEALKGKEQPIVVYGFTDNVGTRENNEILSQSRAASVRDYLVSHGIPQDLVTATGKGPDEPVADNGSLEGRAQNRRVEIVVKPKK